MRVAEGDIIGTKDGRYGRIAFVVTQRNFLVEEFENLADPMFAPSPFWTGIENVASIV